MTPKERNDLRELAATKHKGNLEAAACEFIGVLDEFKAAKGVPNGNAGAVFNIVDELEKYADLDAEESNAAAATASSGDGGNGNAGSSE